MQSPNWDYELTALSKVDTVNFQDVWWDTTLTVENSYICAELYANIKKEIIAEFDEASY
jgi:hypothetical protein